MEEEMAKSKRFSLASRAKSVVHASRGIGLFITTTHNSWVQLTIFGLVAIAGLYFQITSTDWLFFFLCAGLVLTTEALNTAIEIDIDLTSPEYHPFARDTKDVAAGAVLIASVMAAIIGLVIFLPYLLALIA